MGQYYFDDQPKNKYYQLNHLGHEIDEALDKVKSVDEIASKADIGDSRIYTDNSVASIRAHIEDIQNGLTEIRNIIEFGVVDTDDSNIVKIDFDDLGGASNVIPGEGLEEDQYQYIIQEIESYRAEFAMLNDRLNNIEERLTAAGI